MCGLVGMAGNLCFADELFMKRLLLLDFFRGTDSTGLAAIRSDGSTELAKAAVNPITFFDMKSFERVLSGFKSTAFIGHNRAATLGKVNDANAHPYQFGDITGAHNGTLDKDSWERLELEAGVDTDTDSAAVFASIDAVGIDDTIKLMEKGRYSSTGAWALVWYDKRDNTINFIRNEHRPLWYGFNKKKDHIYWASEWPMLNAAAQMTKDSDFDEWWADSEGYTFFPFLRDHLYSIELDTLIGGVSDDFIISEFQGRKLEGREPAPLAAKKEMATKTTTGGIPWQKVATRTTQSGGTTNSNTHSGTSCNGKKIDRFPDDDDIADFVSKRANKIETTPRSKTDPLNGLISEERFDELSKYGCSYCAADIAITDTGYTIYESEDCILCSKCSRSNLGDNVKLYLPAPN